MNEQTLKRESAYYMSLNRSIPPGWYSRQGIEVRAGMKGCILISLTAGAGAIDGGMYGARLEE